MKLLLIPVALAIAGSAHAQDSIRTGYWETTDKVISPISSTKVENRCITPKAVEKFMMGPSNHIYSNCIYPKRSVGDGKMSFKGECADKKGKKVKISASGTYTETTRFST